MRSFTLDTEQVAALLDGDGVVVAVSAEWLRVARLAGTAPTASGVGTVYSEAFSPFGHPGPPWLAERLDDLRAGRVGAVRHEYACRCTGQPPWWRLEATLTEDGVLVVHVPVPPGEHLAAVWEASVARVVELTPDGALAWASPAWWSDVAGPVPTDPNWEHRVHHLDRERVRTAIGETGTREVVVPVRLAHRDGRWGEARLHVRPRHDRDGHHVATVVTAVDVTDEVRDRDRLAWRASHDELTGVVVRSVFVEHLRHELASAERDDRLTGVIFVDVDGFKDVNDRHGHQAGDAVLRAVAERIQQSTRPGDVVGRYGGDEFVVLLPGLASAEDAEAAAGRVLKTARGDVATADTQIAVHLSIGVVVGRAGMAADEVLRAADTAMYAAKQRGGDQYEARLATRDGPDPGTPSDRARD